MPMPCFSMRAKYWARVVQSGVMWRCAYPARSAAIICVVDRSDGVALAGDLRGDALVDLGGQAGIDEHGELGLAEHVDEAGSDDVAVGVDGAAAGLGGEVADGGDAALADGDVAGVPVSEPVPSMTACAWY